MPPKAKYTREEIIETALNIVAEKGKSALNARDLGAALGTSTRPVFTAFKNMSELIEEVKKAAMKRFESYSRNEPGVPAFKSVGMQMISFATNEPKLFQVLYMSERTQTGDFDDLFSELGDTAGLFPEPGGSELPVQKPVDIYVWNWRADSVKGVQVRGRSCFGHAYKAVYVCNGACKIRTRAFSAFGGTSCSSSSAKEMI